MAGINLDGISSAQTAASGLAGLALVTPLTETGYQPQDDDGEVGKDSIIFNYEQDNQVSLESDITDHFVEDNTSLADHIALRPETVTVTGVVGELNNVVTGKLKIAKVAAQKLFMLNYYTPELSATALAVYNQGEQAYNTAKTIKKTAVRSYATIKGDDTLKKIGAAGLYGDVTEEAQTEQQNYFQQFYGYWRDRVLFTVQTPWAIFENMAIKSIRAMQSSDTINSTDFEIQFKMIRKASTEVETFGSDDKAAGRSKNQKSKLVDHGNVKPVEDSSLTYLPA